MENVLDYIILLVVIGLSLIGSAAKRKKAQAGRVESRPDTHSDPWEEIEKRTNDAYPEVVSMPPPVSAERKSGKPTTELTQLSPSPISHLTESNRIVGENADQMSQTHTTTRQSTWMEQHEADFDLESAVVYSVILKPKFEE